MNRTRRLVVAWGAAQLGAIAGGCSSVPKVTQQRYQEKVSTVLITQDRKQFVILGERHHYIFTAPPDLVALLASPLQARAAAQFDPFAVRLDGRTTGRVHLTLPAGLSEAEADQAKAMDFVRQPDGAWLLDAALEGKRYIQNYTVRTGRLRANLSRTYDISVEAEVSPGEQAAEDLASPIAETADGMLMIYFAILVPILLPLVFLTREKRPAKPAASDGKQAASGALAAP